MNRWQLLRVPLIAERILAASNKFFEVVDLHDEVIDFIVKFIPISIDS